MRVATRPSPAVTKATTTRTEPSTTTRFVQASRMRCWLLPVAIGVAACTPPAASPTPAPTAPARPLHRGPLSDFVSAAGLRWLVQLKPQQILSDPELAPAIEPIVSGTHFEAFQESSGVDIRRVPAAVIAGYPYSTLYLAELPTGSAEVARARFSERLLSGTVSKRPHPGLVRITGVIGQTPETLLTMDERLLAVAVGDPLAVKIAEAYAQERLKNSPTALRGAALSTLPDLASKNVAVLLAPGPFADEWQRAARGLLQSTVALAIGVQPSGHGKLVTTLCLAGTWSSSADDAKARLRDAWTTLAQSTAGHLFELNPVADVTASPDLLTLRVELELVALVRGLRASVWGDLSQILRLPEKPSPHVDDPKGAPETGSHSNDR